MSPMECMLRAALEFYGGHDPDNSDHEEWLLKMNEDGGEVARKALSETSANQENQDGE